MAVSANKGTGTLKSRHPIKGRDLGPAGDKDSEPTKEKILGQKSRKRKDKVGNKTKQPKIIESYVEGSAMTMSNPTPNVRSTNKNGQSTGRGVPSSEAAMHHSSTMNSGAGMLLKQVKEPLIGPLQNQIQSSLC